MVVAVAAIVLGMGPLWGQQALTLALAEAKQQALAHNALLEMARHEVDYARAGQLQSLAGRLPQVRLGQQVLRSNDAVSAFGFKLKQEAFTQADFAVEALNKPRAITDYQTTLELRQPIYNGGRAWHGRRQAKAAVAASQAQLTRRQQEIAQQTAAAYWGLVLARQGLAVVRQGLAAARAFEQVAQARYDEGAAPLTDLLAARVRLAELTGDEVAAANRLAAANDGLSLVLGLDSAVQLVPTDSLVQRYVVIEPPALIGRALAARPDLQAQERQIEAARRGVGVERSGYLPQVNAFARVDLDADTALSRQGESWTVGAVASWDLFAGMGTVGAVRQARARLAQAQTQRAYLVQQIERQVRQAGRDVEAARVQIDIGEGAVDEARERLRMAQRQYAEELITAAEVLAAEVDLTRARLRRLEALYAFNVALSRVELVVGGELD